MYGCCPALRRRYKRLVDNIFPINPGDGLIKSNMEKLIFYSLSSPDKLDRIGEYLYQKACKDIYRKRYRFVEVAIEAMDILLQACHAQTTLNLFVESFLRTVQKLLEDSNINLRILATKSFVKFANIHEDTPSYHRRYDFFISKFSAMCYDTNENIELRDSLRLAGIKGLQGVIRKTVCDNLVENIWEKRHMDKIVPSLLFNMQVGDINAVDDVTNQTPPVLAEEVLRELVGRASFGHIRSILKPLLKHLDCYDLWVPNTYAVHIFCIIMISLQAQYSYTVVEILMQHLSNHFKSSLKTRTSVAVVLSKIIAIAAGESLGPSALHIINNLLTHLRTSVSTTDDTTLEQESQYQAALINALGEFANYHPDNQKIEIMLFIMNTVPDLTKDSKGDPMLQNILLKSLLKVAHQYNTVSFEKTFPASFLQPLLKMARSPHNSMRIIIMQIFQALLDRHQNGKILETISVKPYPGLLQESPTRSDMIFTHKHGAHIMQALIDSMTLSDHIDSLTASYSVAALLIVEIASSETIQEFLLFILGIQQVALTSDELSTIHKCSFHAIAIALLALISRVIATNSLLEYTQKIIKTREEEGPYFLPPLKDPTTTVTTDNNSVRNSSHNVVKYDLYITHLSIEKSALLECLRISGMEYNRLQTEMPYALHQNEHFDDRQSWLGTINGIGGNSSNDLNAVDNDSINSSPGASKTTLAPEYTVGAMKRCLTKPSENMQNEWRIKQMQIAREFRENNFDELMKRTEPKHGIIQNRINEIFNLIAEDNETTHTNNSHTSKQSYEVHFPELFDF